MTPKAGADAAPEKPARRRDAEENRRRILDAAPRALEANPAAPMDDIATAAGLSRRTVYGHFPNRDALIESLAESVQADLLEVVTGAEAEGDSPAERYALFLIRSWSEPERLRLLLGIGRTAFGTEGVRAVMAPVNAKVAEFTAAGQADGTFDSVLPATVLARVLQNVGFVLIEEFGSGAWDGDAATTAHVCLVAAGMDRADAAGLVGRLTAD